MIRRVILACFLSCICGIYITKHLGSVLILAAGCAVSAVSTWVFFSGRNGKADFRLEKRYIRACFPLTERRFWYGLCAAAFFLMGTAVGTEAVKTPILFDESGAAWSLEQLDGEREESSRLQRKKGRLHCCWIRLTWLPPVRAS